MSLQEILSCCCGRSPGLHCDDGRSWDEDGAVEYGLVSVPKCLRYYLTIVATQIALDSEVQLRNVLVVGDVDVLVLLLSNMRLSCSYIKTNHKNVNKKEFDIFL